MTRIRTGTYALVVALAAATPAFAAMPRLTGGPLDYILMPLLGYVSLLALARLDAWLRLRRGRSGG
jgi:hypothetical protein